MKAKEVMQKFRISKTTLYNWVKKGLIKTEKTPSGRNIYILDEKYKKL